jgi:hypothetical protein
MDIRLRSDGSDEAWALLEWPVTPNRQPISAREVVSAGDRAETGGFTLNLTYPRT